MRPARPINQDMDVKLVMPTAYPMPFIVGSPRSGTTLLRLMLDAHPQLAIPPETGFVPELARLRGTGTDLRAAFFARITRDQGLEGSWTDFALSAADLRAELDAIEPFDIAAGLRAFYRLYAARFGKPRYGEKTPLYGRHLRLIAGLLPEARFIHLIRDGRDAAVSLRRQWFSPGRLIERQAWYWRRNIERTRRQAAGCAHYLELRYEHLVTEPEAALRSVCGFLELDYDAAMLRHAETAAGRLNEHHGRIADDGRTLLASAARRQQQAHSARPPDGSKIGAWRQALRRDEQWRFRLIAGGLLDELGYPR